MLYTHMQEVLTLKQKGLKKLYLKHCDIFANTGTKLKDNKKVNING